MQSVRHLMELFPRTSRYPFAASAISQIFLSSISGPNDKIVPDNEYHLNLLTCRLFSLSGVVALARWRDRFAFGGVWRDDCCPAAY
jgi:hypothetical protein